MRDALAKTLGWVGKAFAFPVIVLPAALFLWAPWLLIALFPVPSSLRTRWTWALRRGFWNLLATLKFRGNKPVAVPVPRRMSWWRWLLVYLFGKSLENLARVPFNQIFPSIPISGIRVAGHEPADEWDWKMKFFTWLQVTLYRLFSPMQPGLPPIEADPYEALQHAYTKRHRKLFPPPVMPLEFQGSPDLGALAVKGPYACYLKQCGKDEYEWDFRELGQHEHYDDVYNLGVRVLFQIERNRPTVKPVHIESELGISKPGDSTWEFAKTLALCAATNHLALVRHFNGVHLASSAHIAIATRNCLFPDHPLCRLLWPHIFRTQQSNRAVTIAQMTQGGDFDGIFSFTHRGMCDLFSATHGRYQFVVNDPERDAKTRGIVGARFETPTQTDAQRAFGLFRRHARNYIEIYYKSDDEAIRNDKKVEQWLDELDTTIPNGIKDVLNGQITRDSVANLIACLIYLATVQHDIVGSFLWNYQLWAHKQPPRLYRNGERLPLDVHQRLVNANFNLNVARTPLMQDFSYLALDDADRPQAEKVLKNFQTQLADLEAEWRGEPWSAWRIYPSMLEANINA